MKKLYLSGGKVPPGFFDGAVARILELQRPDGAIPWFDAGVFDPWNHTEAAMGLAVAGHLPEAERALAFLAATQERDGSWWSQYGSAVSIETGRYQGTGDEPKKRDTNFVAYAATGVWHHHLIADDRRVLDRYWPMVRSAMDWVLEHQSEHGEIRWAARDPETKEDDALLTGNASIFKSLECAILIADELDAAPEAARWRVARARLGETIRHRPDRFDRTWAKKDNYSMDWYYPVLAGAITGDAGRARLAARWSEFVAEGKGCRCVLGQPWVTVAEACELAMALAAVGETRKAKELLSWQHQWRTDDGAYWMGYQYEMDVPWPIERPAWTAAAVILATDALMAATPASRLFTTVSVDDTDEKSQRFYVR